VPIDTAAMLLEREHELADFGRVLTAARGARGRVILVEGDAGIGKTSLLQAASETAAAAGLRCLRARASELERETAAGTLGRRSRRGCGSRTAAARTPSQRRRGPNCGQPAGGPAPPPAAACSS
jgi:AAA ATPase domain